MTTAPIHTIDVFDTVLTRMVGTPAAVWPIVAERAAARGLLTAAPDAWSQARADSEQRLHECAGQPNLEQIHRGVAARLGYDVGLGVKTARLELEVEREVSCAVPGAAAALRALRASSAGSRAVFVSDTPLPSSFLIELLDRAELWADDDLCFASSECGVSKYDGGLFDHVVAALDVPAAALVHRGDSRRSDVGMARLAGWRAALRSDAVLTRYEQAVQDAAVGSTGVASSLAGAARLARLRAYERGVDRALADVAAGVVGPLIVGFVAWLLRSARAADVRRLYFLARDAEIMLDVARVIGPHIAPEIELRYLYGSRRAWYVAGIAPGDGAGRAALRTGVEETERLTAVGDYLMQEGFDDGTPSGVVDVGFQGTVSRYLVEQLAARGIAPPLAFYYVGLGESADRVSGPQLAARQRAWLFDHPRGGGARGDIHGQVALLETLCPGTHGTVLGYRDGGQRVEPVLFAERNDAVLHWGLPAVRAVVDDVARSVVAAVDVDVAADVTPGVWRALELFWLDPTAAEVSRWGSFPFEARHDGTGAAIAERVTVRSIAARFRGGTLQLRHPESWLVGSAQRSPYPTKALLHALARWRRHGPRLRRIPGRLRWEAASRRADATVTP